jgi:hypothetical protein
MAFIYVITNDINGKQYVGRTERSIEERFKDHIRDSRDNDQQSRILLSDIKKYGESHFSISSLEEVSNPSDLPERESFWIHKLNTYESGYNMNYGGIGNQLYDYDEICKLINLGKLNTEISKILGCCDTTVWKVRKLFNLKSGSELLKKPVDQLSLNGDFIQSFDSISDAGRWARKNSLSKSNYPEKSINDCVSGRRKSAYGFKWQYHNESDKPRH